MPAGGCEKHRGRADPHAKVCKQPGSLLCSTAGATPHAHASSHPHRDQCHSKHSKSHSTLSHTIPHYLTRHIHLAEHAYVCAFCDAAGCSGICRSLSASCRRRCSVASVQSSLLNSTAQCCAVSTNTQVMQVALPAFDVVGLAGGLELFGMDDFPSLLCDCSKSSRAATMQSDEKASLGQKKSTASSSWACPSLARATGVVFHVTLSSPALPLRQAPLKH